MAITYEDIKKANETIKTTDIKGKDYAEVNQRIKAFRMVYPEGFIKTGIVSLCDGVVTMQTEVGFYAEDGREVILGSGYAQEKESSSFINKTSFIENCETSAVGRALGMAGFGIDVSVASAEEVANAIANQEEKPKEKPKKAEAKQEEQQVFPNPNCITPEHKAQILHELTRTHVDREQICKMFEVKKLDDLPKKAFDILMKKFSKTPDWKE